MTHKYTVFGFWVSAFLIATFINSAFALGQKNHQIVEEHLFGPVQSIQKNNDETHRIAKLRKAAEQGDANAQFKLSKTFVDQGLPPETEQEAAKWLRKIVVNQDEELTFPAMMLLGKMREIIRQEYPEISDAKIQQSNGSIGIAIAENGDKDAGIDAAIREANLLFAPAQIWLEMSYSSDANVRRYDPRILEFHRRMAADGLPRAMLVMGNLYADGLGVQQDHEEAVRWYRKAAEQGEAVGQYNLGRMYHSGRGVERDETEAFKWTLKAALKGMSQAEFSMGYAYTHGEGVKQNYGEALVWYKRAAKQGNTDAMNNISLAYAGGRGMEPDQGEVFRWAKRAAERGHTDAQAKMFVYYLTGIGIEPDFGKALAWGMVVQKQRENKELDQTVTKLSKKLKNEAPDQHMKALNFAGELYRLHVQPYAITAKSTECQTELHAVDLTGFLSRETFPGRPNYTSIEGGDEKETGYYLNLGNPICVKGYNSEAKKSYPITGIEKLQLIIGSPQHRIELLKLLTKKENVIVTGTPFIGMTGHYHAPHGAAVSVENIVQVRVNKPPIKELFGDGPLIPSYCNGPNYQQCAENFLSQEAERQEIKRREEFILGVLAIVGIIVIVSVFFSFRSRNEMVLTRSRSAHLNIKRGLFRIWILLALGCWGVGGYFAFDASQESQKWQSKLSVEVEKYYHPDMFGDDGNFMKSKKSYRDLLSKNITEMADKRNEADDRLEFFLWVVALPIAAPIGTALLYYPRGLLRLWVVISLLWCAILGWFASYESREGSASHILSQSYSDDMSKLLEEDGHWKPGTEDQVTELERSRTRAADIAKEHWERGEYYISLMLPGALIWAGILLVWVYIARGFKSKD